LRRVANARHIHDSGVLDLLEGKPMQNATGFSVERYFFRYSARTKRNPKCHPACPVDCYASRYNQPTKHGAKMPPTRSVDLYVSRCGGTGSEQQA